MNARSILILSLGLNLALGAWLVTKLRHPPEASWPAQPTETPKVPNAFPARRRPATDVLGRPVVVSAYEVYRRILPQDEYETPLNAKPVTGTSYVDATAPYGAPLVYTVRAILAKNPKVEGLPAEELAFFGRSGCTRGQRSLHLFPLRFT